MLTHASLAVWLNKIVALECPRGAAGPNTFIYSHRKRDLSECTQTIEHRQTKPGKFKRPVKDTQELRGQTVCQDTGRLHRKADTV